MHQSSSAVLTLCANCLSCDQDVPAYVMGVFHQTRIVSYTTHPMLHARPHKEFIFEVSVKMHGLVPRPFVLIVADGLGTRLKDTRASIGMIPTNRWLTAHA